MTPHGYWPLPPHIARPRHAHANLFPSHLLEVPKSPLSSWGCQRTTGHHRRRGAEWTVTRQEAMWRWGG